METSLSFTQNGRMTGLDLSSDTNPYSRLLAALRRATQRRASDVHLVVGLPPMFRIDGELVADTDTSLGREDVRELIYAILSEAQREEFTRDWQLCVSIFIPDLGHFRVTVYYHMGNVEASIRVCPLSLRTPQELGLPEIVHKLIEKRSGLILITGADRQRQNHDLQLPDRHDQPAAPLQDHHGRGPGRVRA